MPEFSFNRFFLTIVLPSMLAIAFFILSIFIVILPSFERNIMEGKKETISELTNTAWSLVDEYHEEEIRGKMNRDSAQILAAKRIEQIRYGDEYKDYFWIIDKQPRMIMHPYRRDLIGTDLSDYRDPNGKRLFVEAVKVVDQDGEGFINYMWQWKDDSLKIVPKLSFVRAYADWNWIIGTGIYLEDVRAEMKTLKNKLLRGTLLFTILIATILAFIIRQSLGIERRRTQAEEKLRLSRLKYKALVEASTEGTLMILRGKIIFANVKFGSLCGYDPMQVRDLSFDTLFDLKWEELLKSFTDPKKSISLETLLRCSDDSPKEVVISASMVPYADELGYIIIVKEVSAMHQFDKQRTLLTEELRASLMLMNQPIGPWIQKLITCPVSASIREAAALMQDTGTDILLLVENETFAGVLTSTDIRRKSLAEGRDPGEPIGEIMTPGMVRIRENSLLSEALAVLRRERISHVLTADDEGNPTGVFGLEQLMEMQHNSIASLISEIDTSTSTTSLAGIYRRVPVLVEALLESGLKLRFICRIITSLADAIHRRLITLAMEKLGPAPCDFAFIVLGSLGRGEQTLATDQDNAIIYRDSAPGDDPGRQNYFLELGKEVSGNLHDTGYRYCKGDIMASNPRWVQPLGKWKSYFSDWMHTAHPQDILDAEIFFDFRFMYGAESLVKELQDHVMAAAKSNPVFLYHMAESVLKFKAPLNLFGNIIGKESAEEGHHLNIKKQLLPILTYLRLYALKEGITARNSLDRLSELSALKIIDPSSYEDLKSAYEFLMELRLRSQVAGISAGEEPGNSIDLKELPGRELSELKKSMAQISNLQTRVGFDFKGQAKS